MIVPTAPARQRDRGAVDVSIEMLFGFALVLGVVVALFEATAYWHTHNLFDDAAAEGARVAAAYGGTCAGGVDAARAQLRRAASWASDASVTCDDGPVVTVRVSGPSAGVVGLPTSAAAHVPRER